MPYSPEKKELCKRLYIKGWTISEISKDQSVTERSLYNWKEKEAWDLFSPPDNVEQSIARRINILSEKENKTALEIEELATYIKSFGDLRINLAKAEKLQAEATLLASGKYNPQDFFNSETSDHPSQQSKPQKKRRTRKKNIKNDISDITKEMLDAFRKEHFFGYQQEWYLAKCTDEHKRTRFILKSRQIGATYYFAYEALEDAILTGDNQLFLSASRDQAEVFKAYIIAIAKEHFELELKGQGVITLSNGAEIRFLSTNSTTAQSYHGHLSVDEVFWIPHFKKLWKVASGMSAQKKWRRTLFSTPSAMSHEAYLMWSGEKFNENKPEKKQVEFDLSHKILSKGSLGADKIWRHVVTIQDAEKQGCDLFDIEELKTEYSAVDFDNLFMCKFIDDALSVFTLQKLLDCMVDTETWTDYHPKAAAPLGNRPVSVGYDLSRTRDNASIVKLSIPLKPTDKWRVLDKETHHGVNFTYQANRIKEICNTHSVKHVGVDITGIGHGVFEMVESFYPRATPINYSVKTKTELVLKALDVIENGRFQYSAGDKEITQAFMMISKTTTPSGQITYAANRSNTTGHADVAWAIMHALAYEDLVPRKKASVSM